jgi:serine/threonine protein kinase
VSAPPPAPHIPGLVHIQPLGSGGYADVYLYEQQSPRMNVAVKVLKRDGLTPAIRRQFVEEANTMAALADHPYIVQVFRSEQTPDGGAYLVMKYYPPPNLAVRAKRERFTVEEVLRTGIQLASAVETAHRAGIVHRDIKPANVLVSQYGAPGLTDFGIAGRALAAHEEHDDDVGVSVPWAPPEILYGQSNGDVRSDVYSLAATLWHLLVGRSPFEQPGGDNSAYALMPRIRATPVPPTGRADVPLSLERLLAHGMAKNPAARPQSALEFARGLQAIETEQRLPRTPLVVLDESGDRVAADTGPSAGSAQADDDRTMVRTPQSVSAQSPVPAPVAPTQEASDVDAPRTISGGVLLAIVGVVIAVLVGALVWAMSSRGGQAADGEASPSPSQVAQSGGGAPILDLPEQPALDGRVEPGSVIFTWNYGGMRTGDFYRMRVAGSEAELADASVQSVPMPYTVPAPSGAMVCAQVAVSRGQGATGPYSAAKCLTVP